MKKILVTILIICLAGCARHKTKIRLDPEDAFAQAKREFTLRHYEKAIDKFKIIIFEYPADKWTEESQYLLAKSSYKKKDYAQAKTDYDFFVNTYPRSRFTEKAEYELAMCYFKDSPSYSLEQTSTIKAVQEFEKFNAKYPDSKLKNKAEKHRKECINKLAKKELETAKLYIRLNKPESAIIYLKSIQQNYPDNSFSDEVATLIKKCEK